LLPQEGTLSYLVPSYYTFFYGTVHSYNFLIYLYIWLIPDSLTRLQVP
jgi:hypothetical protein